MFYFTFLKLLLQKHFTYVYVYFLVGNLCLFFSLGFRLVERNPGADDRCKRNQAEWPSAGGRFSICPQLYTGYVGGCQKVLRSPSVFGQFQSDSSSGFAKKKIQIQYRFFFFFYQKIFFSSNSLFFFSLQILEHGPAPDFAKMYRCLQVADFMVLDQNFCMFGPDLGSFQRRYLTRISRSRNYSICNTFKQYRQLLRSWFYFGRGGFGARLLKSLRL